MKSLSWKKLKHFDFKECMKFLGWFDIELYLSVESEK